MSQSKKTKAVLLNEHPVGKELIKAAKKQKTQALDLSAKTFEELSAGEKDQLLKTIALKLKLLKAS